MNTDTQSLQALEHYINNQPKTETQIILQQLTKHLNQQDTPTTLNHQPLTHQPYWTTTNPHTNQTTTWHITLTQTHLHLKNTNQHHHTYELANPNFPNNLTQDIKNWLPQ